MAAIPPIGMNGAGRPGGAQFSPNVGGLNGSGDLGRSGAAGAGSNSPTQPTVNAGNLYAQIADLLQSAGTGSQTEQLLRTIMALLILATLLQSNEQATQGATDAMEQLGSMGSRSAPFIGVFSSSTTTVFIEHSVTMTYGAGQNTTTPEGGSDSGQSGGQLDIQG